MYGIPPMSALVIPLQAVTVEWTGSEGNPTLGAAKFSIPYRSASQYVGVGVILPVGADLTGKPLRARVKIASGFGDPLDLITNPGGVHLYVKTGASYVYATGTYTNLTAIGSWVTIEFDLSTPSFVSMTAGDVFDPKDVRELGIQFDTSATTSTAQPAVVLVDSVGY